ncbi:MAG: hypothetical protein ACI4O7_06600 [Aristaeellaceae bacterium]
MSRSRPPEVQCVYAGEGAFLPEVLAEAFRLYLRRMLDASGADAADIRP